MKKSLLLILPTLFLTASLSAESFAKRNLDELHIANQISDSCFKCIDEQLSTVETNELACLKSKIHQGQTIDEMISEFKVCTKEQLTYIGEKCALACIPQDKK